MIHGIHMVIPRIFLDNKLNDLKLKNSKIKYFLGILFPALGTGVGIGIMFLLTLIGIK